MVGIWSLPSRHHLRLSDLACWTLTRWTYAASKGAINILTKDMALDLAPFNIRNPFRISMRMFYIL